MQQLHDTVTTAEPAPAELADRIDAVLPQTQCQRCGYPGCRPYAEALARGDAGIDRCPPGGDEGALRLARLLDRPAKRVDRSLGEPRRVAPLAVIDEAVCIGCTKCIQACPVDAIVGANGLMHTVIAAECTGCELCIPPCPVDCIALLPGESVGRLPWNDADAAHARARHAFRGARLSREAAERAQARESHRASLAASGNDPVAAALARARARRSDAS